MKMTETSFKNPLYNGSSYIVYIARAKVAADLHQIAMSMETMHDGDGWYFHVSTNPILKDCRVPTFFHNSEYYATIVEHNNGDWDKAPTYKLYLVEE